MVMLDKVVMFQKNISTKQISNVSPYSSFTNVRKELGRDEEKNPFLHLKTSEFRERYWKEKQHRYRGVVRGGTNRRTAPQ